MKFNRSLKLTTAIVFLGVAVAGCDKEEALTIPPAIATFAGETSGNYFIQNDPNSVFSIPVGVSNVSDKDRTVSFTVSSPSGAAAGQQYTINGTSVVIPAGKATGSIDVKGIFAGYPTGRRDTLLFTLTSGDVAAADFNNTYTLVLQKYCTVSITAFTGTYNVQDYTAAGAPDGPPYTLGMTPGTASGTKGSVVLEGLWGSPDPLTVNLDWTNPANFTTSIADQNFFMHPQYGQVKIRGVGTGSFSSCDNSFLIRYEAYVPNLGTFGNFSTTLTK